MAADDNKKDQDLTRIEDLGEYLHELNQEDEDEENDFTDSPPDFETDDLLDAPTDPNLQLPDEFEEARDFGDLAESGDDFETNDDFTNESSFESEDSFSDYNDDSNDFEETDDLDFADLESEAQIEEEVEEAVEEVGPNADSDEDQDLFPSFETEDPQSSDLDFADLVEPEAQIPEASSSFSYEKTPLEIKEEEIKPVTVEDFSEVKDFASNTTYSNFAAEGNPPFSIIIKDLHYLEDINEIIDELLSFKLVKKEDKEKIFESFMRGSFLISRISEFAAITLCHKLRRFNVTTLMGLSSEIHPSSADEYSNPVVSKHSVYQNRQESIDLDLKERGPEAILTSTTSSLEGHHILKYVDIISEHMIIDMHDFEKSFKLQEELTENLSDLKKRHELQTESIKEMNQSALHSQMLTQEAFSKEAKFKTQDDLSLNDFYKTLTNKLKNHAMNLNANAVVGINFMISPLIKEDVYSRPRYQISATGNAVWAKPL